MDNLPSLSPQKTLQRFLGETNGLLNLKKFNNKENPFFKIFFKVQFDENPSWPKEFVAILEGTNENVNGKGGVESL